MSQSTPSIKRLERLTGLPLDGVIARVLYALGLDAVEKALAQSASQVSAKVHRKLERICGVSLPPARRRHLYRGLGIDELEARLLLTTITWDGGGTTSNWSDAANWSTNTVPTSADNVVFDGTSAKNVVVNSTTRTVQNMLISGSYTGTISLSANLNVTGNLDQSGGTLNAGSRALSITGNTNLTGGTFVASSATTTLSGNVIVAGASFNANNGTIMLSGGDKTVNASGVSFNHVTFNLAAGGDLTVVGTMDVNGNLRIQGSTTSTFAAGTVTVAGNLTTTNTGFTGAGLIVLDGSGNQTFSGNGQVGNLTIQKSGGTLTLANTIYVAGNWQHISGAVNAGTSTVVFQGGDKSVDASGMSFNNVTLNLGAGGDLTVIGTMDVNGNLLIQGSTTSTLAAGTMTVAGNLTTTNTGFTGAGLIVLDGSGNQTFSGNGQVGNLTVQKAGGTLTLANTIYVVGNLTHVSGNVDGGTSTVMFRGIDQTVDASGMLFNNVTFNLPAGSDLTVVGVLDVNGNLLIQGSTTSTLAAGTVNVAGNLTTTNTGFTGAGLIVLDGAANQTFSGSGQVSNISIQKSGGTLTLASTIYVVGNWQHVSGTVNAGTSTVMFRGIDQTVDASGMSFNNVTFNLPAGSDLTVVGVLDVNGNLLIQGSTTSTLAAGTVNVAGNLTTTNTGFTGAGLIVLDGAANQTFSGSGQVSNISIQKSGGTLTLASTIYVVGNWQHVSGTVNAGTSTVMFRGIDQTVDASGMSFNNVTLNLGAGGDLSVIGTMDVNGNLLIQGSTTSTLASGTMTVGGNLTTTNSGFSGGGTIVLDGTGNQTFSGTGQVGNVSIQKSAGTLTLSGTIYVVGDWQHQFGTVNAGSSTVVFQGSDQTVDASAMSFYNVTFNLGTGGDLTVVGTLDVNRDLRIQGSTTSTLTGGNVTVARNLTTVNTGFSGTGTIVLDGAGSQTFSGNGQVGNVTIQKSAGTLTLANTIEVVGNWLYVSGTVNAGSSTVVFQGGDKTVDANGMSFYNVTFDLDAGGDLTVIGTLDVNRDLVIQGDATSTLAAGIVTVARNVTTTNAGFSGAGTIILDGTGNQTISAGGGTGRISNLSIQKSAGTTTVQNAAVVAGDLNLINGTVAVAGSLDVEGNLNIQGGATTRLTSGIISVAGNVTTTNTSFNGAGTILVDGSGDQILSALGGAGQLSNLTINKTGGTLTIHDTIEIIGDLVHVAGTVDAADSTFVFEGANQTIDAADIWFHGVVVDLTASRTLTIVWVLDVNGDMTIIGGLGNITGGQVKIAGNLTGQGAVTSTSEFILDGTSDQLVTFDSTFQGDLTVEKTGGVARLAGDLTLIGVGNDLLLKQGSFDAMGHIVSTQGLVDIAGGTLLHGGTIIGDVMVSQGGTVFLVVNGFNPGQYDQLIVSGTLTLGADSHLALDFAGVTGAGSAGDIARFGSLSGEFTDLDLSNVPAGHHVELSYDTTAGTIGVSVIENIVEQMVFPIFQLRRFDTSLFSHHSSTETQPIFAGPHHFVTSPKPFESFKLRGEFDPPEPRRESLDNTFDAGWNLLDGLDESGNPDELEGETETPATDDVDSDDFDIQQSSDAESTSADAGQTLTTQQASPLATQAIASNRIDALDDLFAEIAHEGIGDENLAPADSSTADVDGFEIDGTAIAEAAALAAIIGTGAVLPALLSNKPAEQNSFEKIRRIALPHRG